MATLATAHPARKTVVARHIARPKPVLVCRKPSASLPTVRNKTEIISVSTADLRAHAHDLSNDALARHLINSGLGATLRKLTELLPYLEELTKRFAHLRKGQTILGYSTLDSFCRAELHRTSRAVHYALNGGNSANKKNEESEPKSFWAHLAHAVFTEHIIQSGDSHVA